MPYMQNVPNRTGAVVHHTFVVLLGLQLDQLPQFWPLQSMTETSGLTMAEAEVGIQEAFGLPNGITYPLDTTDTIDAGVVQRDPQAERLVFAEQVWPCHVMLCDGMTGSHLTRARCSPCGRNIYNQ
jgi:hypothetical protein